MPLKNYCIPCIIDDKPCPINRRPNMSIGKICSPLKDLCPTHAKVNIDDSEELIDPVVRETTLAKLTQISMRTI
jgi:hypothetical protein